MDKVDVMRAFATVAELGSFTKAADALRLSPSIVTKRVAQLEHLIGRTLFERSTRRVQLTADGEHSLKRVASLLAEHDEVMDALRSGPAVLEGLIRVKVPTTLGSFHLNSLIRRFANEQQGVDIEVLLLDGPLNPSAQGIDIAITAFPASFDGVADEFLWPIQRSIVASPEYLYARDTLEHPRQLERHRCLVYQPTGPYWTFLGETGLVGITVKSHLTSNDMSLLLTAAVSGDGIALISDYVSAGKIVAGQLRRALVDFPIPNLWVKAMVPTDRRKLPRVDALLRFLKQEGQPKPDRLKNTIA